MAVNKWDKSEYERQMSCVKKAANAYTEWIDTGLGNVNVTRLMSWVEEKNITTSLRVGLDGYRKNTVKLHDLHKTMKQYMEDYEDMIAKSQTQMENVEEVESTYGSFGTILAGISVSTATALSSSKAYKFTQSGKTFSGDYNDLTAFMNDSWGYDLANFWHGVSKIGDMKVYGESIRSAIAGEYDPYVMDCLKAGLKSMVESIPASKPVSITNIDWEALGEKLGIENLEKRAKPLIDMIEEFSDGNFTEDKFKDFITYLEILKEAFDSESTIATILDGLIEAGEEVQDFGEFAQYAGGVIGNYLNGYADQISYLETMKSSLLEMGYWEDSPVMQQIDELKNLYDDRVLKTFEESKEAFAKTFDGGVKKVVVEQVPVLKDVTKFWGFVSKGTVIYGNDRVKAASELMGCMQFDNILTETYEHYSNLVESGAATAEEIAEADRLFEMVKALKIKEYKAMQTISEGHDEEWYKIATEKLSELGEKTGYTSERGSSGAGRGGGGRRG